MRRALWASRVGSFLICGSAPFAFAGGGGNNGGNGDFVIRADFRTPENGQWAADTSVGHATFRVVERFGQMYYGGVIRLDEYRFTLSLDFTENSDYVTEFASSPYNSDYDVYINNKFIGRVFMNNIAFAQAELQYDSRHPTPPALPLPPAFPDPVNVGDVVRLYFDSPVLPPIGAPLPPGNPVFQMPLEEEFARGDVNQDGEVDDSDFPALASNYDPFLLLGNHVGPASGDFTGDNLSTIADYNVFLANWTGDNDPPAEPLPVAFLPGDATRDGLVNINDLTSVILNWGSCPVSSPCLADVTLNGAVDIDDLTQVILNWD